MRKYLFKMSQCLNENDKFENTYITKLPFERKIIRNYHVRSNTIINFTTVQYSFFIHSWVISPKKSKFGSTFHHSKKHIVTWIFFKEKYQLSSSWSHFWLVARIARVLLKPLKIFQFPSSPLALPKWCFEATWYTDYIDNFDFYWWSLFFPIMKTLFQFFQNILQLCIT